MTIIRGNIGKEKMECINRNKESFMVTKYTEPKKNLSMKMPILLLIKVNSQNNSKQTGFFFSSLSAVALQPELLNFVQNIQAEVYNGARVQPVRKITTIATRNRC